MFFQYYALRNLLVSREHLQFSLCELSEAQDTIFKWGILQSKTSLSLNPILGEPFLSLLSNHCRHPYLFGWAKLYFQSWWILLDCVNGRYCTGVCVWYIYEYVISGYSWTISIFLLHNCLALGCKRLSPLRSLGRTKHYSQGLVQCRGCSQTEGIYPFLWTPVNWGSSASSQMSLYSIF